PEDQADGLAAEPARGPALLVADLGGQGQRPQAGGLAAGAGRLVQQGAQVVVAVPGPDRVDGLGGLGLGVQARQTFPGEGAQGVAGGLDAAGQGRRDLGGTSAAVAEQQDLAAAQGKGIGGAQALTEGQALGGGQGPNKERLFHT